MKAMRDAWSILPVIHFSFDDDADDADDVIVVESICHLGSLKSLQKKVL